MPGNSRTIRVRFDPNQYQLDTIEGVNVIFYFLFIF